MISGMRRFRNGNTKTSSQKTWPRYASPWSPRAGTPASRSLVWGETVCSRWKMCRRTRAAVASEPSRGVTGSASTSSSMSNVRQRWCQASPCAWSSSAKVPARAMAVRASRPHSLMARSREV